MGSTQYRFPPAPPLPPGGAKTMALLERGIEQVDCLQSDS